LVPSPSPQASIPVFAFAVFASHKPQVCGLVPAERAIPSESKDGEWDINRAQEARDLWADSRKIDPNLREKLRKMISEHGVDTSRLGLKSIDISLAIHKIAKKEDIVWWFVYFYCFL
jgi:hypothetical protein